MDGQQYLAYSPPPHPPPAGAAAAWSAASQQQQQQQQQGFYNGDGTRAYAGHGYADVYGAPPQHQQQQQQQHPHASAHAHAAGQMSLGLSPQVDASTGPSRPRTRRQVAREQSLRSVSAPGLMNHGTYYASSMSPPPLSRPQTPTGSNSSRATSFSGGPSHPSGHISPPPGLLPASMASSSASLSPPYPSTPVSASSTAASRYSFPYHARSVSGTTSVGARSASPALSVRSALTSLSSTSASRMSPTYYSGDKQKKTRLTNAQRRQICLYQQQHPTARQEDMAIL